MTYDDKHLRHILTSSHTIAIVGAKDKPGQAVDAVGRALMAAGYTVIPVHPVRRQIWGLPTWASLAEVPEPIDIVNVFREAAACPEHAREAAALAVRPAVFWMQLGIRSACATAIAQAAGMQVVEDRCIKIEHRRLLEKV